jgi:hypothetical protein
VSLAPVLRFESQIQAGPVRFSRNPKGFAGRAQLLAKSARRGGASPQRDTPHNNSQSSICESICFALDDIRKLALAMSAEEFADAKAELHCVEARIYMGEACVGDVQVA